MSNGKVFSRGQNKRGCVMVKEKPFIERHPIIVSAMTAVIGGFFGGLFPFVSNLYQIHSSLAKGKSDIERGLAEERVKVSQKDERIVELRTDLARLQGKLDNKESQLAIKELQIDLFRTCLYDHQDGLSITNEQMATACFAKVKSNKGGRDQDADNETSKLTGPISRRLGLTDDMSLREKIEVGWSRPLYVPEFPGLYLRAPQELLTSYLGIIDDLTNYTNCVRLARVAYVKVGPMLDPFVKQGAEIDVRFAIAASTVYQLLAEDELNKGNYERAAFLIGTAAGVLGPKPPPHLLAMESAISMRRNPSTGFMSQHIIDATNYAKDENYKREIFQKLAILGYLQYYLPNKDNTDIGEAIDWDKLVGGGRHIQLRPTFKKDGDVWSTRWKGLGEYEPYNVSENLRQLLKPR